MLQFVWQNLRQYTHCVLRCLFRKLPELAILRWLKEDLVNKPFTSSYSFHKREKGKLTDELIIAAFVVRTLWLRKGHAGEVEAQLKHGFWTFSLDLQIQIWSKFFFFSSEIIMLIMMFYCSSRHLANGVRTFINSELTAADAKMKVILNLLIFWRNNFFNLVRKLCK